MATRAERVIQVDRKWYAQLMEYLQIDERWTDAELRGTMLLTPHEFKSLVFIPQRELNHPQEGDGDGLGR